jgi:broad specificity phosphatase PhoE
MGPIVLVRHARPLQDPSRRPAEWGLHPSGTAALSPLADELRALGPERLLTSPEPKAVQTGAVLADLLGVPTEPDPRLHEVRRPPVRDDAAFTRAVETYLGGGGVVGWEAPETVVQRMQQAVDDALALGLVGFVSHATALSLYVQHLGLAVAWEFWNRLKAPDGWLVEGTTIRRIGPD